MDRASAPPACWQLHIARSEGNQDVASSTYVSINSLKGYIRSCYATIGVTTRTEAVMWAIQHRFPSAHRTLDLTTHP